MCGIKPKDSDRAGQSLVITTNDQLRDATQRAAELATKLEAANRHIVSLQDTIRRGSKANESQSLTIKDLRAKQDTVFSKLAAAEQQISRLSAGNTALSAQLSATEADRNRLLGIVVGGCAASETAQITELRGKLAESQYSSEALIHEVLALRQQLSILAAVSVDLAVLQGAPVTYVSDAFDPSYVPHG